MLVEFGKNPGQTPDRLRFMFSPVNVRSGLNEVISFNSDRLTQRLKENIPKGISRQMSYELLLASIEFDPLELKYGLKNLFFPELLSSEMKFDVPGAATGEFASALSKLGQVRAADLRPENANMLVGHGLETVVSAPHALPLFWTDGTRKTLTVDFEPSMRPGLCASDFLTLLRESVSPVLGYVTVESRSPGGSAREPLARIRDRITLGYNRGDPLMHYPSQYYKPALFANFLGGELRFFDTENFRMSTVFLDEKGRAIALDMLSVLSSLAAIIPPAADFSRAGFLDLDVNIEAAGLQMTPVRYVEIVNRLVGLYSLFPYFDFDKYTGVMHATVLPSDSGQKQYFRFERDEFGNPVEKTWWEQLQNKITKRRK